MVTVQKLHIQTQSGNDKKYSKHAKQEKVSHQSKKTERISHVQKLTVSALVVEIVSAWEIAAITLDRLFSIVTSVGLCNIL